MFMTELNSPVTSFSISHDYHRVQRPMLSKGAKKMDLRQYHMVSEIFLPNDYRTE